MHQLLYYSISHNYMQQNKNCCIINFRNSTPRKQHWQTFTIDGVPKSSQNWKTLPVSQFFIMSGSQPTVRTGNTEETAESSRQTYFPTFTAWIRWLMYSMTRKHRRLSITKIKGSETQLKPPKSISILITRISALLFLVLEIFNCFQTQSTLITFINTCYKLSLWKNVT